MHTETFTVGKSRPAQPAPANDAAGWSPTDPRIGVRCTGGAPVYYAYVAGIYCESTQLKAIETALATQELQA